VPARNDPTVHTWSYTCNDPDGDGCIFAVDADLRALSPATATSAPLTTYSVVDSRLVGSHWNLLGIQQTYYPNGGARERIALSFGTSPSPMRRDMQAIIGESRPVAVQVFESAPTAIEGRGFYISSALT
ncbi:MAG: hypothetical protein AAGC55_24060, partial [Myxococcota bacterium]